MADGECWMNFQRMLNEFLNICEKWYLLMYVKAIAKTTRNKSSGGCILQIIFIRSTSKTWNTV